MSNTTQSGKIGPNGTAFNPTITAMFEAPKFAARALQGETGAAFLSAPLDAKALTALRNAKEGEKLLLKRSVKLNKSGEPTYFLEVLPVFNKTFTEQVEDGI